MHLGNDGFVGGAAIEVASSSDKRKRLKRPLQNLLPVEFREVGDTEQVPARPEANTFQRQRRSAAITRKVRRREVDWFLQEQDRGGKV